MFELMIEVVNERGVVATEIEHLAAHPREAFAKAKIICGIGLWRLTRGPIPVAFLHVHDVNRMILDGRTVLLKTKVMDAAQ